MDLLFAQTAILLATLIITIVFTIVNLKLSDKNRVFDNISSLFRLRDDRDKMRFNIQRIKQDETSHQEAIHLLSNIQLQMRHILFDIDNRLPSKLNASQYRLLADCCEDLLYVGKAMKYWEKALSCRFPDPAIRCEYYRHFGEFLYRRGLKSEGDESYKKSLYYEGKMDVRLQSKLDEIKYIHFKTCESWVASIHNSKKMNILSLSPNYIDNAEEQKVQDIHFRMFILANGIKDLDVKSNCLGKLSQMCDISTLSPT